MEMDSDLHKYTMILLLRLLLIMNNYSSELCHQCYGNTLMWSIFQNVNYWKLRSIMRPQFIITKQIKLVCHKLRERSKKDLITFAHRVFWTWHTLLSSSESTTIMCFLGRQKQLTETTGFLHPILL